MKFLIQFVAILFSAHLLALFMPWYSIAIAAFLMGKQTRREPSNRRPKLESGTQKLGSRQRRPERCWATWRRHSMRSDSPGVQPDSSLSCQEADVSNSFFELTQTGNELLVKANTGESFSAPIAPDGSVKTSNMDFSGNVNARDYEAFNKQSSCRFKLTPV